MRIVRLWAIGLCLLGLALEPVAAQASPRDDALAGAFRCAPVSRLGVWLDCYYGAAQPVRGALGLPPALPNQIALAKNPPDDAMPVENAVERAQVMASAARCDSQVADRAWLNCYYSAAQILRARLGLKPSPQMNLPGSGLDTSAVTQSQRGIRFSSYKFDARGFFTVTLANGQVWRQESGDTEYARWTKPADAYAATFVHGMFGDFNMRVAGTAKTFKVHRVS